MGYCWANHRNLIIAVCLCASIALAEDKKQLSLKDCYDLALRQSESLARKENDVKTAQARYDEALSRLLPELYLSGLQRIRNSDSFGRRPSSGPATGERVDVRSQGKDPQELTLSVRQPLFNGLRDYYTSLARKAEVNSSEHDRTRQAELLYLDVSQLFFQIRYYSEDVKILSATQSVLEKRINELARFVELGKARESEVIAAKAELALQAALKTRVLGLESASKELLGFLIGLAASSFELREEFEVHALTALDNFLERAVSRADILGSKQQVESSKQELRSAERERWPELSLEGNYYTYEDPDQDRDWELLFRLDLPIYTGGGIESRIAQSQIKQRSAELSAQEILRQTEKDVRVAYSNVQASIAEVEQLTEHLTAARKNYGAQNKDYQLGLVTNLDVLAAIRLAQEAERRLLEAKASVHSNMAALEVAAGGLPQ